jgi:hypothetical protein
MEERADCIFLKLEFSFAVQKVPIYLLWRLKAQRVYGLESQVDQEYQYRYLELLFKIIELLRLLRF